MRFLFLACCYFLCVGIFAQSADSIRVSLREGTNMAIALSPDKNMLALDLQGTIWTLPTAGGIAKALTDNLGDCRQPSWAPNGNTLVFQSYRDGGWHLWTIDKDGRNLKQITFGIQDDREPQWSPDGKRIVFSSDRNNNYDLWEMDVEKEVFRPLTNNPGNDYNPCYAPDGKSIAFISDRSSTPGVFILAADGSELHVASGPRAAAPSYSLNGGQIIFFTTNGAESKLLQVDLASQKVFEFTEKAEDPFPFRTAWISDNEILYTADGLIRKRDVGKKKNSVISFEANVYLHRPTYTRKQYDFDSSTPRPVKGLMGPGVSPDGKKVVFAALGNLWLLTIGDPSPVALTQNAFVNIQPAWSPDNEQIAYTSDRDGSLDIWIKNLRTNSEQRLTRMLENEEMPTWSPDGKFIAFLSNEGNSLLAGITLWQADVATGETRKLHAPISTPGQPTWSPDGQHVLLSAFVPYSSKFREGINKFLLISMKGEPDRYFSPTEGKTIASRGKNGPVWAPDGRKLAYTQDGVLWTLPMTPTGDVAGPPVRLTNELSENPSWSGDSKSIVYLATDQLKRVTLSDGHIELIPLELSWKQKQPVSSKKIIHAGRLFDGQNNAYRYNVDIIIKGNRIQEIIPHRDHTTDEVIDASNSTVIPGMFDMHAHQSESEGEKTGRGWLSYGITSVREPGSDPYDAALRKEVWSSGVRPGPREFFTGALQDGSRVYYNIANSVSAGSAELELGRARAMGFDFLKTYVRMPDYMQKRFTTFAHQNGMAVSSHEIYPAASYGVDAIEHVGATSRRGYSPVRSLAGRTYQDVIALITQAKVRITPTAALVGGFNLLTYREPALLQHRQYVTLHSASFRKTYEEELKKRQADINITQLSLKGVQNTVVKLVNAGNHITAGTDSPFMPYGFSIHLELQTYVDGGLSTYHALQSATLWAAESLGVEKDLGSIEAGKLADIVIIDGDPLKNIRDAWNVRIVMKNGFIYTIDTLLTRPTLK